MESKYFFEVFDGIKTDEKLQELFSDIMVKRIVNNRAKSSIRIYIDSNRLIHKSDIYKMEKAIAVMLRGKAAIKIMEHFNLSSQYNSENLFKMYKDSIMLELYNYSRMEYSMLNKAEITFDGDIMNIKLADTVVAEDKSAELKRILEKIFNERCGIATEIRYEFVEVTENKYEKINELKMKQEVDAIISGITKSMSNHNGEETGNGEQKEEKSGAKQASAAKKDFVPRNEYKGK